MYRAHSILFLILVVLTISSCGSSNEEDETKETLAVFAGISLTDPFQKIAADFSADNENVEIQFNLATGQQHLQQMENGAHADVFAAAKESQITDAIEAGFVNDGDVRVFAQNKLIVALPSDNPASLTNLEDLARPGLRIAIGTEETAVGQYTLAFFDKTDNSSDFGPEFSEDVLANVVSYETSVKSVLSKVLLGEVDAGIVFTADIATGDGSELQRIEIPEELNVPADYFIAVTTMANNRALAQEFVDYILSPQSQATLVEHGFVER